MAEVRDEPITIAIPFVSGIAYLREAIASALALPDDDVEIVVVDNTPDAKSARALRELIETYRDPRLRLHVFGTHVPACTNFNRAMDAAGTDLVTLLHADDTLMPNYVSAMRALARDVPQASAYYCEARIIDEHGRPIFSPVDFAKRFLRPRPVGGRTVLHGEPGVRALAKANFIMCPTVCFRRSELRGERWPEDQRQVADLDLWTRILFAGGTLVGTAEPAYRYRRHRAQTTAQNVITLYRFEEEVTVLDLLAQRAEAHGWHAAARVARRRIVMRGLIVFESLRDVAARRFGAAWTKMRYLAEMR